MEAKELFELGLVWPAEGRSPLAKRNKREVVSFGVPEIDSALPFGGLACGGIHEFFPIIEKNNIAQNLPLIALPTLLAARARIRSARQERNNKKEDGYYCAWIGKESWPAPFLLEQVQNGLREHALLAESPSENRKLSALETALRVPGIAATVATCNRIRFSTSRRLSLAAEEGNSIALLIRSKGDLATQSSALTRWLVSPHPSPSRMPRWKLTLLSCKGEQPRTTEWIVELQTNNETLSLHIPADVARKHMRGQKRKAA